jgi:biopolymer transport protein ExbD
MRKKHGSDEDEVEVDLTPMLDIVFIMLIFFIVTATFIKELGIDVAKPNENTTPPPPDAKPKTISLAVTEDCWVRLQGRRIDPGQVSPNVQRLLAERPGAPGIITVEGEAPTKCVTEVMDQMIIGGVGNLSLRAQEAR